MRQVVRLDRRNSDIQEADCRGQADKAHIEYRVKANQMGERNRVQELDLYEWVLWVNVEVDIDK